MARFSHLVCKVTTIFVSLQTEMKKLLRILLFLLLSLTAAGLSSCGGFDRDGKRLQKALLRQEAFAESRTATLAQCLQHNSSFDSVRIITQDSEHILFYIFDKRNLVYWSDNWLATDEVVLVGYDRWWYSRFRNAHAVARWTKAGEYNILTVIPLKYAYPIGGSRFQNKFIPPFRGDAGYDISRYHSANGMEIFSTDGNFLFTLLPEQRESVVELSKTTIDESFTFRQLSSAENTGNRRTARVQVWFIISMALMGALLLLGILVLIRYRGFRNMSLRMRFVYVIIACILASFVYVFALSIRYVRSNYEQRQQDILTSKCKYVQSYLQSLYYWDMSLTQANTAGLNVDLRDLSLSAGADIHVYDNQGVLVGSSTPGLFTNGLLSTRISPKPFFSLQDTLVQYEQIGDMRYLCAYAPFYNGSYVQIGYISVPSFVSEIEKAQEVDNLLARLLPPYLVVLLLAFLAAYLAARSMTAPLSMLTDKMRHFRIGNPDNHIDYKYHDEVGELVERYNAMVDLMEQSAARLAKAEREGAWRTMARQIAHEIKNPLTPMKLTIQQLRRLKGTDRFDAYFDKAAPMLIEQIDNLSHIATSFSTFAKQPDVTASEVDVAQKLTNVITLIRNNPAAVPVRYIGPDHGVPVWADAGQISQVFTNILRNAIQAMEGQENADIIVILKEAPEPDYMVISFSDNGPGIPEDIRERIFMPNFTTKNTGMGLGLAISKNIVEGSGGKICFETSEKGTTFFVYLRKKQ